MWLQESRRVGNLRGDEAWLCVHERMLAELVLSFVGSSGPEVGFLSHYLSASWPSGSPQALALPVCAASSRKLVPGPPASSTLTRSMLSARSAPPPCPASPTRRRSRPSTSFWWKWTVSACHQPLLCGEKCFRPSEQLFPRWACTACVHCSRTGILFFSSHWSVLFLHLNHLPQGRVTSAHKEP